MPSFVRSEDDTHYLEVTRSDRRRLELYLARRYFQMTPQEWDQSPWWYTQLLMDGLTEEGILGDPNSQDKPTHTPGTAGKQDKNIDLSGGPIPGGFQTRRVG